MVDIEARVDEVVQQSIEYAEKAAGLFKSEWDARRDVAKTLISLSGATLVFTITFSRTVIKPETPLYWRYAIVVCWIAFICTLLFALASLWFSMELSSLPLLMTQNTRALKEAAREAIRVGETTPILDLAMQPFEQTSRKEQQGLWLLRGAMLCFGIALTVFTAVGLRELLNF
jgi:hypothetical protein